MDIRGVNHALSFQMAKAYGVSAARQPMPINSPTPPLRAQQPDSFEPASSAQRLVAGKVAQPVNFDPAASVANNGSASVAPVYQMYTRAADKIEAAVAVQIGRAIDLRG